MQAVTWALSQSIKVLGIVGAWMLFKAIVSGGSQTIRDLIETVDMGVQAGCYHLKRLFWEKIKRERKGPATEEPVVDTEGSVN